MAADVTPTTWLGAGFSVDTVNHLIKLNTSDAASNKLLKQLTDAQANVTTGNVEQILLAICEMIYQSNRTQVLAGNKPLQMSIQRSGNPDFNSGGFFMSYQLNFNFTDAGVWTMVAES